MVNSWSWAEPGVTDEHRASRGRGAATSESQGSADRSLQEAERQQLGGEDVWDGESAVAMEKLEITRPGKLTKNYGTSPFFIGKSTINGPFSIAMLV